MKWDFIGESERELVYTEIAKFLDVGFANKQKKEKREVLNKLFNYYNKYVAHNYNPSSVTCGSCVSIVTEFFKKEEIKWRRLSI